MQEMFNLRDYLLDVLSCHKCHWKHRGKDIFLFGGAWAYIVETRRVRGEEWAAKVSGVSGLHRAMQVQYPPGREGGL